MSTLLNKPQQQAVQTTKGRVLVLAGAGSGKTRVITYRIAHLLRSGVKPENILGLTFTNKAAKEMQERIAKLINPTIAKKVTLSTFHSFCVKVLRKHIAKLGYTKTFSIYDERDNLRILKQIVEEYDDKTLPSPQDLLSLFSDFKNKGKNYEELIDDTDKQKEKNLQEIFQRYDNSLKSYNALDFDSILSITAKLLNTHQDIAREYQNLYQYIMIDEYQDTNNIQYQIAEAIAKSHNNLFVVGDDDQSIYGWRGADVKHILEFKADSFIKLEENYRSYPSILHAANHVISHNKTRHQKKLFSSQKEDEKIHLFNAPKDVDEAQGVVDRMIKLKEKGYKWKDMAILYRSNALSRNFEMALINASWKKKDTWVRGIPYEVFGGLAFSERSEIKDLISYLRVIANPSDQEALLRIINVPRRGISDKTLSTLTTYQRSHKLSLYQLLYDLTINDSLKDKLSIHARAYGGICSFVDIIEEAKRRFETNSLKDTFKWLVEAIQYRKAIEEDVKSEKAREIKDENVQECISAIAQYEEEEEDPTLYDFIATTALAKDIIGEKKSKQMNSVKLMTFHSSKGLEFPICFLVCLEDQLLPHEKSMMDTGIEEERRLFYVAITRAMKHLTLSMSRSRRRPIKYTPTNPSRFLYEIPKDLIHIESWKVF